MELKRKRKILLLAHHALGDLVMKAPLINYLNSLSNQYDLHITVRDTTLKKFCNKYLSIPESNIHILNMQFSTLKKLKTIFNFIKLRPYIFISPPSINRKLSKLLGYLLIPKYKIIPKSIGSHKIIDSFNVTKELPLNNPLENFQNFYKINMPDINKPKENKIIIHPGSGEKESFKQYPKEKWVDLIIKLKNSFPDFKILITGHGMSENNICEYIENKTEGIKNLSGMLSLDQLINEISTSKLFISADCGPSHLASILKTKQITLFGPTDPRYTGALNTQSITSSSPPKCSPCYGSKLYGTSGCVNNICITEIPPLEILHLIIEKSLL